MYQCSVSLPHVVVGYSVCVAFPHLFFSLSGHATCVCMCARASVRVCVLHVAYLHYAATCTCRGLFVVMAFPGHSHATVISIVDEVNC